MGGPPPPIAPELATAQMARNVLLLTLTGLFERIMIILYVEEAAEMTTARMIRSAVCFAVLPFLFACSAHGQELRAKAGAYYFDGWTGAYPYHITERLTTEFFDREPVWGWRDDSLEIVEQQIDYAADNGLSFFAFDWYYPEAEEKETPLNTGLEIYLQAKNKNRLEFCLLVANHGGYRIGQEEWDAVCDIWIPLMKEPTHLKVNGEPLLIFFAPWELHWKFGGSKGVKKAFESLREKARAAGLKGVAIAGCFNPCSPHGPIGLDDLAASGYSSFTGYNYHGYMNKGPEKIQAFANMVEGHEDVWKKFAEQSACPHIPVVTCGWDKRAMESPDVSKEKMQVYYPDTTVPQVADFVDRAIRWMDEHPDKTTTERLLMLFAWNEYGEGGYIAPTKTHGDAYLKAIHKSLKQE